jgi:hypothetical protein
LKAIDVINKKTTLPKCTQLIHVNSKYSPKIALSKTSATGTKDIGVSSMKRSGDVEEIKKTMINIKDCIKKQ